MKRKTYEKRLSYRVNMVEEDAVEGSVDAVVQVVHVADSIVFGILGETAGSHLASMEHVGHKGEWSSGEETSRLSNEANVLQFSQMLVDCFTDGVGDAFEGDVVGASGESSSQVDDAHLESETTSQDCQLLGMLNSSAVGAGVVASAADVEADSNHVEVQFLGSLEQLGGVDDWLSSELQIERTSGGGIGDSDTEDHPEGTEIGKI